MKISIKMIPGQKPYTEVELKKLYGLVDDAAAANISETEETEMTRRTHDLESAEDFIKFAVSIGYLQCGPLT